METWFEVEVNEEEKILSEVIKNKHDHEVDKEKEEDVYYIHSIHEEDLSL